MADSINTVIYVFGEPGKDLSSFLVSTPWNARTDFPSMSGTTLQTQPILVKLFSEITITEETKAPNIAWDFFRTY